VFLSLDLEPIRASHEFNRCLFRVCAHVDKTDPVGFLHEFNRRIKIASAHIEELAKFPGAHHRNIKNAEVSLSKFGTWAKNIGWRLSDKFPRQTASDQPIDATDREADASTLVAIKTEPVPTQTATTASVVATDDRPAPETKEQRQDCRLKACIDAGLPMNEKKTLIRLPDGVGDVADSESVTRQTFSTDVKAALERRESAKREGVTMHRA
jgi:hypothetical protein